DKGNFNHSVTISLRPGFLLKVPHQDEKATGILFHGFREELSVIDFLNEQSYNENSEQFKIRNEIVDSLKKRFIK
ncbi:hypothetical protein OQX61_23925, partial [Pedobacter sp. PLR]|uniref:hypothetical protein n=1 Tax=Pedobacter sp. PLR TaxID=2994465 RepID=UPI002247515E